MKLWTGFREEHPKNNLISVELQKIDLNEVFYSALSLLGITDYFVSARFANRAGLSAEMRAKKKNLEIRVSDAFECAPREVLLGLALSLTAKLFGKKIPSVAENAVTAYREFCSRESVASLSNSLRALRGRNFLQSEGRFFELNEVLDKIFFDYPEIFGSVSKPKISWSRGKSKRRLGFHDAAFEKIVLTKALDSPRVPAFVVDYIVFHELLHCKHKVLYQRGRSLRRTVHPRAFKQDEKKFARFDEAEEWLKTRF